MSSFGRNNSSSGINSDTALEEDIEKFLATGKSVLIDSIDFTRTLPADVFHRIVKDTCYSDLPFKDAIIGGGCAKGHGFGAYNRADKPLPVQIHIQNFHSKVAKLSDENKSWEAYCDDLLFDFASFDEQELFRKKLQPVITNFYQKKDKYIIANFVRHIILDNRHTPLRKQNFFNVFVSVAIKSSLDKSKPSTVRPLINLLAFLCMYLSLSSNAFYLAITKYTNYIMDCLLDNFEAGDRLLRIIEYCICAHVVSSRIFLRIPALFYSQISQDMLCGHKGMYPKFFNKYDTNIDEDDSYKYYSFEDDDNLILSGRESDNIYSDESKSPACSKINVFYLDKIPRPYLDIIRDNNYVYKRDMESLWQKVAHETDYADSSIEIFELEHEHNIKFCALLHATCTNSNKYYEEILDNILFEKEQINTEMREIHPGFQTEEQDWNEVDISNFEIELKEKMVKLDEIEDRVRIIMQVCNFCRLLAEKSNKIVKPNYMQYKLYMQGNDVSKYYDNCEKILRSSTPLVSIAQSVDTGGYINPHVICSNMVLPTLRHEFIRGLLMYVCEANTECMLNVTNLLGVLIYELPVFHREDISYAFARLLSSIDDMEQDCPYISEYLVLFIMALVLNSALSTGFLYDAINLHLGGTRGFSICRKALRMLYIVSKNNDESVFNDDSYFAVGSNTVYDIVKDEFKELIPHIINEKMDKKVTEGFIRLSPNICETYYFIHLCANYLNDNENDKAIEKKFINLFQILVKRDLVKNDTLSFALYHAASAIKDNADYYLSQIVKS